MENHKREREYTLEGPAYDAFREAHDQLIRNKLPTMKTSKGFMPRVVVILLA